MNRSAIAAAFAVTATLCWTEPAQGQSFTEMVAMRDNVHLATDVYLPSGTGPWPVVLVRTPYDKASIASLGDGLAAAGIATVGQDMRGRFASEGLDMVFTTEGDGPLKDGYDTIGWITGQTWCDGHVGTTGGSALGIVQYMQSTTAPDGLVVINPVVATTNFYQDLLFWGGCFRSHMIVNWLEGQGSSHFLDEIAAHPYEDDFWASSQTADQYGAVTTPGLHEGGWYDILLQGTVDAFVGYQHQGGTGAQGNQKLIMGPWTHGGIYSTEQGELSYPANAADSPYAHGDAFNVMLNHYLELGFPSIPDTPDDIPNVQYYVMGDVDDLAAPGNEWRTADDWPPPAAPVRLHLQPDGTLAEGCPLPDGGNSSYLYDPADPSPTICGTNLILPAGPCDQRPAEARQDTLVFSTPVLTEPLEVTGHVRAHLYVDIDQVDTDLMVRLTDVYPDGRSMLVADGALRLASRGTTTGLTPLSPGEVVEAVVDLWSTSIILNAGHQLRISVTSSNYPRFAANLNNGLDYPESVAASGNQGVPVTVHLHHSADAPSYIELPDPSRSPEDYTACDGSGGSGGAGGVGGTGGAGAAGGAGGSPPAGNDAEDDSGCGCRVVAPQSRPGASIGMLWTLALVLRLRRRRHPRS